METPLQAEPLVEFGSPVTMEFRGRQVPAYRDVNSGYIFFEPPPAAELFSYYQDEYTKNRVEFGAGLHTIETDYDPGKNQYQAGRILQAYRSVMGRQPRTAFELGCAYGGLVAEMARRGIETSGSDINGEAVRLGAEMKGTRNIFQADNLEALARMERKVDLIFTLGVLEHDPNMLRVVEACRGCLTEEGLLWIMMPNGMFASSILNGFKYNLWVNYPQHLHMPSPGFIPWMCRELGFLPLFWDTRILFEIETQRWVFDLFNEQQSTQARRDLWSLLLLGAGYGMELNFALTPHTPASAERFARIVQEVVGTLEHTRQQEVRIRQYLKTATP